MLEKRSCWLRDGRGLHSVCQGHDRNQNYQRMGQVQVRTHAVGALAVLLLLGSGLSRADASSIAGERRQPTTSSEEKDEIARSFKSRAWEEYVRRGGRAPMGGASAEITIKDGKVEVFVQVARSAAGAHFTVVFDEKTGKVLEYVPGL